MRDLKNRLLVYLVVAAVVAPLTCVLPLVYRDRAAVGALFGVYVGAALIAIVLAVRSMRRESRRLTEYDTEIHGVCPGCGYDLRETPDRCPECGRAVNSAFQETPREQPPSADAAPPE